MVNLKQYDSVSELLPDGLYYSKKNGLTIQSNNGKILFINPEHLQDIEEDLLSENGTLSPSLVSEGVLPEGLSFNSSTGILTVSSIDGNAGGLVVKDLMAITSIPVGEEDGTSGSMYLLNKGKGYYIYKEIPDDHKSSLFGDIVISDIDSNLYSEYWGIQFKINNTNSFVVVSVGENFKANTSSLSTKNYKITGDYKNYTIDGIGDGEHPVTSVYWLSLLGGLLGYNTSKNSYTSFISSHAFENTNVEFGHPLGGSNTKVQYTSIGPYAFSGWHPASQWDEGQIVLNYGGNFEYPECVLGEGCFKGAMMAYIELDHNSSSQSFHVGESCFEGCTKLIGFSNAKKTIFDPMNFPMASIAKRAFYGCTNLKEIYATNSTADSIGESAFENCTNLEAIYDFTSVNTVGKEAFYGDASLQTIELADTLRSVGKDAFYGCKSLQSINSKEIIEIGDGAFYNCSKLNMSLPSTVQTIGSRAFSGCSSLKEITFSKDTRSIGSSAFEDCENLIVHGLPSHAEYTVIQDGTFDGCTTDISEIPSNITEIGSGAFANGNGKILKTKGSSLTVRESGFVNFTFEQPIDAVSITSYEFEKSSFAGSKGELKVNHQVYEQLVQNGRVLRNESGQYYIDSQNMIVTDGGE